MIINKNNIKNGLFIGKVVNIDDPDFEGKIKIAVHGLNEELSVEALPWAIPFYKTTSGSSSGSGFLSVPKLDSLVFVSFPNGDIYHPIYHTNFHLSEEWRNKFANGQLYPGLQTLYYDTENNYYIYYVNESNSDSGLIIRTVVDADEGSNQIRIKENNSIEIKNTTNNKVVLNEDNSIQILNANNSEVIINSDDTIQLKFQGGFQIHIKNNMISLGSENQSEFKAVLYEELKTWLEDLLNKIGQTTAIPTPSGPSGSIGSSPNWNAFATALKNLIPRFKSDKVTLDR